MGQRSQRRKLQKYITEDNFPRLKSYLRKHRVNINGLQFEGGDRLVHLACRQGHDHLVWYLLRKGADPLIQNDVGQVALHLACLTALEKSHYVYYDLVLPLAEKARGALSITDNMGVSPRHLVANIKTKLAAKGAKVSENESTSESDTESWNERLANELEDEYAEQSGKYEPDFRDHYDYGEGETWDQWANRISQQVRQKRHEQYLKKNPGLKKKLKREEEMREQDESQAEFQRKLEQEHEEYMRRATRGRLDRLKVAKQHYEEKCAELFNADRSERHLLSYSDIPWPTPANWNKEQESMREFLLCDVNTQNSDAVKKCLRDQKVRWHPDKFLQRCGSRLKENERERILEKVKLISQILNTLTEKDSVGS